VNSRFVPAGGEAEPKARVDMRGSDAYRDAWFDAIKNSVTPKSIMNGQHSGEKYAVLMNALSETGGSPAGSEGGFTAPVDVDGRIIELMRQFVDLGAYVTTEPVSTNTGWRVIEKAAAALPLTTLTELAVLADNAEGESPTFSKITFSIADYGDFLRASNDILNDSMENLINYLARWFSKKVVLTHNSLILAKINAITGTAVADYKTTFSAIKTVFNKTLDPAFSASASVFTNQSGMDVLDQLLDGDGRPLLQSDLTNATGYRVKGRPVVVLSDAHWANMSGPARSRIAIGSAAEYARLFSRAGFQFDTTNVGGSAWRSYSTEVRGIARMDVQEVDTGAMTVLKVTLPA
jgi:HK97 family phage major capsid protein